MRNALRIIGYFLAISAAGLLPSTAQSADPRYGFCLGIAGNPRVNNFTPVFDAGSANGTGPARAEFIKHMHQRYAGYATRELGCQFYATEAEARSERQKLIDLGHQHPKWPVVEIDWKPAARAPELAKPATPPAPPASAAPAAPPKAAAPAKPAMVASKPGVYVICRSEWSTDLRRFYNPPVEGRGAGYAEWQASYRAFLVSRHKFKGTNLGCGKYPTRAAAQTDYDAWIANARATPLVNGQPSPVIITDWKY